MHIKKFDIILFGAENVFDTSDIHNWTNYIRLSTGPFRSVEFFNQEIKGNNYFPSACMYIFKRVKYSHIYFEPYILHEDNLFTTILLLSDDKANVFSLSERLFLRRLRSNSIMTKKKELVNFLGYHSVIKKLIYFIKINNIRNIYLSIFIESLIIQSISIACLSYRIIPFHVRKKIWSYWLTLLFLTIKNRYLYLRTCKIFLLLIFPEFFKVKRFFDKSTYF